MKKELFIQFLLFIIVSAGISFAYLNTDNYNFEKSKIDAENEIASFISSFDEIVKNEKVDIKSFSRKEFNDFNLDVFFDLYIYENKKLVFWNSNNAMPDVDIDLIPNKAHLVSLKNGYYIIIKKTIGERTYVGLELIRNSYSLVNKYLTNSFSEQFNFSDSDIILPAIHSKGEAILSPNGDVLFKIQRNVLHQTPIDNIRLFLSLIIFFGFYLLSVKLVFLYDKKNHLRALGLAVFLAIVLCSSVSFIPYEFKKLLLFKPELYGSSFFSSLGMLFIVVLAAVNISFQLMVLVLKRKIVIPSKYEFLFSLLGAFVFVSSSIVIRSLVLDSVLNYSAKNFAIFNTYTILVLLITFFISLVFIVITALITLLIKKKKYSLFRFFGFTIVIFSLLFFLEFGWLSLVLSLIYYTYNFVFIFFKKLFSKKNSFSIVLLAILFMLVHVSAILFPYAIQKNENTKKAIAHKISRQRDFTAEDLFSRIEDKIVSDAFILKFFKDPLSSYSDLYKRIDYKYFGGYFSKYDIKIVTYNKDGKKLKNYSKLKLEEVQKQLIVEGEKTLSEKLFLFRHYKKEATYISILDIFEKDSLLGYLMIEIIPKSNNIGNVYPELLLQGETKFVSQVETVIEHAIYVNNKLLSENENIEYPQDFADLQNFNSEYSHFILKVENSKKTIVVSSRKNNLFSKISIFSFLMSIFLVLGFVMIMLYAKFSNDTKYNVFELSFRNQITAAMLLLVMFSFLVFGITTVGYFSKQYNNYHKNRLIRKEKAILKSIQLIVEKNRIRSEAELSLLLHNIRNSDIKELSAVHKMDMNIFGLEGKILASSQKDIYSNGLVSNIMNPSAFIMMHNEQKNSFIQDEKIDRLKYLAIYVPIINANNEIISYLNIPYFSKEKNLREDVSNFMMSFVNVYVFLFIIGSIIAFFVSNSLTKPLKVISDELGNLSLNKKNKPIDWESDDEIGVLVKEYNSMLIELESSVNLLAQNERDEAWREMAKQIAHEIKNPLTPMKLSIQHLQRAIADDPVRAMDLTKRVSKTLIEQIDNLTDIATAFSTFAKMPVANKEVVNLIEVIDSAIDLFNRVEDKIIIKEYKQTKARIFADKNQMISVFNNIVKNALQAVEEVEGAKVIVSVNIESNFYLVKIYDNGVGISDNKKHKVFVPNFTTKSSGTGLGLAISKQIIENIRGQIWFESIDGVETTFFIKIPINQQT